MSQLDTVGILIELGGTASRTQMRERAEEKYPQYALSKYISRRIIQCKSNGYIVEDIKTATLTVTEEGRKWFKQYAR